MIASAFVYKPYSYVRNPKGNLMAAPHHTEGIDWDLIKQFGGWILAGLSLLGLTKQNIPNISEYIVNKLDSDHALRIKRDALAQKQKRDDKADALQNSRDEVSYLRAQVDRLLNINSEQVDRLSEQSHQINELLLKVAIKSEKVEQAAKAAHVIDNLIRQAGEPSNEQA